MFEVRYPVDPSWLARASAAELRSRLLVEDLFVAGEVRGVYTHEDRMVIAGAVPREAPLALPAWEPSDFGSHLAGRELGVVNVGGPGVAIVDGEEYRLEPLDGLYAGRGSDVQFVGPEACFFLVSAAAAIGHPVGTFNRGALEGVRLGDAQSASVRTLYRYVGSGCHPSCQLQFGVTVVDEGSVWNTLPPHVHDRRSEVYLYLLDDASARVVHLLGEPGETRHLLVRDRQAVISPSWSVHAGAGTSSYAFVWAMAGENTAFEDITPVPVEAL